MFIRILCVSLSRNDGALVFRFPLHGFYFRFQERFCKLSVVVIFLLFSHLSKESFIYFYLFTFFIMNIYVGNLNYRVREDDLKQVMEEYGTVESVKIIKDRETGKSKGFGFVEMPDDEAAKKAIAELNEAEYEGRQMVVKEARPK